MGMSNDVNLNSQIKTGLFWNFLERGGLQIVTFVVQLILARLLTPEDYGILAIVSIFISFSSTFVNNGLANAVVQKKNSDSKDFNTVFYFQLAVAVVFVFILWVVAPWIAIYYDNSNLTVYLRVMSLTLLIDAFYSMQVVKLKINMQFKKAFLANVAGIFAQAIVGVSMAMAGCGVWSLIVTPYLVLSLQTTVSR